MLTLDRYSVCVREELYYTTFCVLLFFVKTVVMSDVSFGGLPSHPGCLMLRMATYYILPGSRPIIHTTYPSEGPVSKYLVILILNREPDNKNANHSTKSLVWVRFTIDLCYYD